MTTWMETVGLFRSVFYLEFLCPLPSPHAGMDTPIQNPPPHRSLGPMSGGPVTLEVSGALDHQQEPCERTCH